MTSPAVVRTSLEERPANRVSFTIEALVFGNGVEAQLVFLFPLTLDGAARPFRNEYKVQQLKVAVKRAVLLAAGDRPY